ncbi:MAG: hypothetical protein HY898_00255 [Deltaproteobacteria bacterium]|nr:hypothetical protein [Deltaproteobacteria bacterium]
MDAAVQVPAPSASEAALPEAPSEPDVGFAPEPTPKELTPEHARGYCTGRAELRTSRGDVNCYPYRCRAGRCLLRCTSRTDCAGADNPKEMAKYGWPLDCADSSNECYPLHPRHVTGPRH